MPAQQVAARLAGPDTLSLLTPFPRTALAGGAWGYLDAVPGNPFWQSAPSRKCHPNRGHT